MSKAINNFINRSAENDTKVIKLSIIDFFQPSGVREKTVVKEKNNLPHEPVIIEVREVTYLYNKKTTRGWEIVKEIMVPRGTGGNIVPKVVGEVTRDLRKEEKPKFNRYQDENDDNN